MKRMLYAIAVLAVVTVTPCLCTNNTTASNATIADNRTTLYIGALFNLDVNPDWGILPMAEQAVQEVNNNTHILPGYKLQLVLNSTRGNLGFAQHVFQEYLNSGPKKIMLLGPADDTMTKAIASYAALPHVRLMQFSYGTSDLDLANRRHLYPYFFRTAPSRASYDEPRIAMLKYYNWKEVGIVYGDSVLYMKLANQFKRRLQTNGVTVLAEVRLQSNDPTRAVRTMKDRDVHVIFGMFEHDVTARRLFCSAYRNGMYGPHYVWILLESYNLGWWLPRYHDDLECHKIEMKCQLQNHFSFWGADIQTHKTKSIGHAQKNVGTILNDYYARVDGNGSYVNRSSHALNVHDALWSIALVLDRSRAQLDDAMKSLENFTYGDRETVEVFYNETLKLKFSSPNMENVKYFRNGNRNFDVTVNQLYLRDGNMRTMSAGYFQRNQFIPSKDIHWFAGVPYRRTEEHYTYRTIDAILFLTLVILASLGLLYALICYISVAIYMKRTERVLLDSSGFVSLLIILGCMLNYITVILYGFDYSRVAPETVTRLCRARAWTFSLGFSLSVGGLVAKLWIAYTVLSKRALMTKRRRLLWMLFLVLLLLVFDVVFLTCWEMTDPLYRKLKIVKSQPQYKCFEPITADTFKVTNTVVETCSCTDLALWLSILLVFKSLVLLFGAFLARQTRKLYIPSLDDSRRCGTCVFVALIFCVAGIIAAFAAELYPTLFYGFVGFFIIFVTTFILGFLFTYVVIQLFCKSKHGHMTCQCCVPCCNKLSLTCAKSCQCCPCCVTCCVTCWSWIGRCALTCCQSWFGGPKVPLDGEQDPKLDYVIIGQPFDREAHIMYLRNTIKERDEELAKLRHKRNAIVSAATQTYESTDDDDDDDDDDDCDDDEHDDNNEDQHDQREVKNQNGGRAKTVVTKKGNANRKKFKKAARKIRIHNQKLDFSHIQSKVDSNLLPIPASPGPSTTSRAEMSGKRGSTAVEPSSAAFEMDEELTRLKILLLEREAEIQRLKKDVTRSEDVVRPRTETKQSLKISVQDNKTGSSMLERESVSKRPSLSTIPSQSTSIIIDQNAIEAVKPNQSGDDNTSLSPPPKDEAPTQGMDTTPEETSEITPAGVWLLEGIRDRVVMKDDERKEVADENEQLDASCVKKAGLNNEALSDDEALEKEKQPVQCEETENEKRKTNEGAEEPETTKQAEKKLHDQFLEEEENQLTVGQMSSDKGEAREDDLLEPIEPAAALVQSTKVVHGNDVEPDSEKNEASVEENTPAVEVSWVAAQYFGSKPDGNKLQEPCEVDSKPKCIDDTESGKLNEEDTKQTEDRDGEFDVIDDRNYNSSNTINGPNNKGGKNQDNNNHYNESAQSGSGDKNTETSCMFEVDEEKKSSEESDGKVSSRDNTVHASVNDNVILNTVNVIIVKAPPIMRHWSKVRWAAASKVDTRGQRSNPYRTSITSYKPRNFSHVRSRLFNSSTNGNKGTTNSRSTTTNNDERRVPRRPMRARRQVRVVPTADYPHVQSRLNRNSEDAMKRDPVKPQLRGKPSNAGTIHSSK